MITKELETIEKPNIFDKESAMIKFQKRLRNDRSPQNIHFQQTKKIKAYTESEVADRTLQFDVIKRHIPPKKILQLYETQIINSKNLDEQLNLKKFHIKSKLFEITKKNFQN